MYKQAEGTARSRNCTSKGCIVRGKIAEAIPHYRLALKTKSDYIDALYLLAKALEYGGAISEPETLLRRAVELQPNFSLGLSSLGGLLVNKGDLDEAKELLDKALELQPQDTQALCNMAYWAIQNNQTEEAIQLYKAALASTPNSEEALSGYTTLLERLNRLDEATSILSEALSQSPTHAKLNLSMAKIERRARRWEEVKQHAEVGLAHAPSPAVASAAHMLLGQALDELRHPEEALQHFQEGKRLSYVAAEVEDVDEMRGRYLEVVERMAATLCDNLSKATPPQHDLNSPIFLIGFPRSGTTLLEQILDAHPALQTIEELPMAARMADAFFELTEGREDPLSSLSETEICILRDVYFQELAARVHARQGAILVDKLPLNTIWVPLLWRVFPNAKFILSIRHPFDACLSCFMQDFEINAAMSNFTTLDGAITLYLKVMGLWKRATELMPL